MRVDREDIDPAVTAAPRRDRSVKLRAGRRPMVLPDRPAVTPAHLPDPVQMTPRGTHQEKLKLAVSVGNHPRCVVTAAWHWGQCSPP